MAISNTFWDESKPVDGLLIPDIPQSIRFIVGNTEALLGKEHRTFPNDSNSGAYHSQGSAVTFYQASAPTTRADTSAFESADLGRLWIDSDDNQIYVLTATTPTWTSLEANLLASANTWAAAQTFSVTPTWTDGVVANNVFLKARNAADDGNVALIKANVSDVPVIPDGSQTATDAAPSNDVDIANKKYVDTKEDILVTQSTASIFGSWTNLDSIGGTLVKDGVYKVGSDGFVSGFPSGNLVLEFFTDGSNPPTTKRIAAHNHTGSVFGGFSCPVKKDDYWKVTVNSGTPTLYWLPIGTGTSVKQ